MNVKEGLIFLIQNRLTGEPDIALCPILSGKNPNLQKGDETNSFTTYDDTIDMF